MTTNYLPGTDFYYDPDSFGDKSAANDIRANILESEGIDIFAVYCLHTGKRVGEFDIGVITDAIADEETEDFETLCDSMLVRCVASMRPSPALNKPDVATIQMLHGRRPIDALAYLLNRLYGSRQLLTAKREDTFAPLYARIRTHARLTQLGIAYNDLTHWLLELDSKMNLHDVTPPMFEQDRLGKWLVTRTGKSVVECLTGGNDAALIACFESWVFAQLAEFDKRDSQATREANWLRGNSMTKRAYVRSWIDNPEIANRKAAETHAKKNNPGRPKSEKTIKLDSQVSQFMSTLEQLINGEITVEQPKSAPRKLMLGGSLFKGKKESNS